MTHSLRGLSLEQRLFCSLPGDWTLTRAIPDIATMTGTARFHQLEPALLHCREDGRLTLSSGQSHSAYREYHYRLADGLIQVCFAEPGVPRILHTLRLAQAGDQLHSCAATDIHHCGNDTYTGRYEFPTDDRFTVEMRVVGPRKDYSIHTTYDRILTS
ncbi:MAG: DUF6314 family protein [Egibacteraceae bacterium]